MPDVVMVSDLVERMRSDLATLQSEFENANSNSSGVAEHTGHGRLGEKLRHFASSWQNRRRDLIEQITTVRGHLDMIDTNFGDVEVELARSFEEEP